MRGVSSAARLWHRAANICLVAPVASLLTANPAS